MAVRLLTGDCAQCADLTRRLAEAERERDRAKESLRRWRHEAHSLSETLNETLELFAKAQHERDGALQRAEAIEKALRELVAAAECVSDGEGEYQDALLAALKRARHLLAIIDGAA